MSPALWRVLTRLGVVVALTVVWTLLWGEVSGPNVVTGLALSVALLVLFPLGEVAHVDHRIHPLALVRLGAYVLYEMVVSTLSVGRDVLLGPSRARTAIVACPLRVDADGLITFLANIIALSPGTFPIDVSKDPLVLYVHVLRIDSPEAVRARVTRLEDLAVRALGSEAMITACRAAPAPATGVEDR